MFMMIRMQKLLFILLLALIFEEKIYIISGEKVQNKEDNDIYDLTDDTASDYDEYTAETTTSATLTTLPWNDEGKMTTPEMDERFLSFLWKKIMNIKPRPQTEVLDEQYEKYLDEDEDLFYLSCVVLSVIAVFGILSAYYCLVKKNMLNILPEGGLRKAEEGSANDDNSAT